MLPNVIETYEKESEIIAKFNDVAEIKNVRAYWDFEMRRIIVIASQEWKDYILGKCDARPKTGDVK